MTRDDCAVLDRDDPLAPMRDRFVLPEGVIYLDGNSLGPTPRGVRERIDRAVAEEWGRDLITSWNRHDWIGAPLRIGAKIARLVGAAPDEVVVADSTSVNLFKVLSAALAGAEGRTVVLSEPGNFPTDLYMAQGLIRQLGRGHELKLVEPDGIEAALDDRVAVLMLTHVDYRTGRMHDMAHLTRLAQARGARVLWDLAHSAGAVPVDLGGADADYAVGCGYKFLNGGPGAPAFLYVARRHQESFAQPLSGWLGHAQPFAFESGYRPAEGARRYLCGTPPILSLLALEAGLDLWQDVDLAAVRAKSLALSDLFMRLVDERCAGLGLEVATPRAPERRGSQVSLRHPDAYPVMQALIHRGVIGDVRAPDILRFGITPLYLRHRDVWDAVECLRDVLASRAWDRPEFHRRQAVT